MKKLVAFVAFATTLSFASCGNNKSAETTTEPVAETEAVVEEVVVEEADSANLEVAPADSTAVEEVVPAK